MIGLYVAAKPPLTRSLPVTSHVSIMPCPSFTFTSSRLFSPTMLGGTFTLSKQRKKEKNYVRIQEYKRVVSLFAFVITKYAFPFSGAMSSIYICMDVVLWWACGKCHDFDKSMWNPKYIHLKYWGWSQIRLFQIISDETKGHNSLWFSLMVLVPRMNSVASSFEKVTKVTI